ncbi:MAG: dihydrolipoyl dehydrogenase [Pseudomonadota bacterium]
MSTKVCVIGAGPGGYVAAIRAAQLGATVTLVEKDNVGGTCLNNGCIPSKTLKTTADLLEKFHHARNFGISISGTITPDIKVIMERKNQIIQNQRRGIHGLLKHQQIALVDGDGYIEEPGIVKVRQADGNMLTLKWDKLILALGSTPLEISAFPFDGKRIISSTDALSLSEIPESMVIVGGGVIGCEFACILSALGTDITLVEALPRLLPLPSVDESCSKVLEREMKKRKIKFFVNKTVESIDMSNEKLRVVAGPSSLISSPSEKELKPIIIDTDKVLVCIGRSPVSIGSGLDKLNIQTDEKGWVLADEQMQTNVPDVYAIGDMLGPSKIMLAHVASAEGRVAAENAMGLGTKMNYRAVPGAIFTSPEVATVGLSEAQAGEQGISVTSESSLFRTTGKAQATGEIAGHAKIVSDADTGRVLGLHIIGPHATDLIAEGTLAVQANLKVEDLANTIHAHPTLSEIICETALKIMGKPIHG